MPWMRSPSHPAGLKRMAALFAQQVDAVEKAANALENTINCCVGLGGNPDRDGFVTLDASIMDGKINVDSVGFL